MKFDEEADLSLIQDKLSLNEDKMIKELHKKLMS